MIKEIIMKNVKGTNSNQELTGKDLIIGANGIGKSTRLQALSLAMLGYVPGSGKTASETFKLSSGEKMTTGLTTDNFSFSRSFQRKTVNKRDGSTDYSISQSISLNPSQGERTIAQKEARILAEIGNFPVMLDFNEFLTLSDSKRREFIYNLSGFKADNWTKDKVENYLETELLTIELEVNNEEQYKIMRTIINEVMEQYPERYDVSMGLQTMIDYTKDKLSQWKKELINSKGATKKMTELKHKLKETDRDLINNKAELETLYKKLEEIQVEIAKYTKMKNDLEMKLNKINKIKKEIEELKSEENPFNKTEIENVIKDSEDKIMKLKKKDKEFESNLILHRKFISTTRTKMDEIQEEINIETAPLDNAIKQEINKIIIETTGERKGFEKTLNIINKHAGTCVLDKRIKCDKDFTEFKRYATQEIKKCNDIIEESTKNLKVIEDKEQKSKNNINKLKDELKSLKVEINKTEMKIIKIEQLRSENTVDLDGSQFNLDCYKKNLYECSTFEVRQKEKIRGKEASLQEIEFEELEPYIPLDILEKQYRGVAENIKGIKEEIEEQQKAKLTMSNLKSSMIDSKKAEYMTLNLTSLNESLGAKGLQGELVKESLSPIAETINENLKLMGIDKEFYFSTESDRGKEIFQFGWVDNDKKRNFDALSTGQQLMVLLAILIAFIEKSNPKLKVLTVDNIENLDKRNFDKVMNALSNLSNKLDNIILSGVVDITHENVREFKVWDLG